MFSHNCNNYYGNMIMGMTVSMYVSHILGWRKSILFHLLVLKKMQISLLEILKFFPLWVLKKVKMYVFHPIYYNKHHVLPCRCSWAGYCFLFVSASASGNTSFSHTSRHPILTKLGHTHNDRYLDHYSPQTTMGSVVRMGSLESKRSFSPKKHQVLQNS